MSLFRSEARSAPWWTPETHADRRPFLMGRNALQTALRGFFGKADFIEVDTATLQVSPGNETHLHAFATQALTIDGRARLHPHS
jgi:lysyl-tRNA synthetase class 2